MQYNLPIGLVYVPHYQSLKEAQVYRLVLGPAFQIHGFIHCPGQRIGGTSQHAL